MTGAPKKAIVAKLPIKYHTILKQMAASQHRTITAQIIYLIEQEHCKLAQHKLDPQEEFRDNG